MKTLLKLKFLILPCMVFITIILPCIYQLRPPTLHSIFEKERGSYTKRALFYQDILLYSRDVKESSFKDRQLTHWLLKHNLELRDYYSMAPHNHTPPSTQADNRVETVKERVRDLINLGLMRETGTAPDERGGTRQVQLYGYAGDGLLLTCLIESFDQNKREQAYNEAYDVLQSILSIEPCASYEIFYSALYKEYKDKGVFGEFIMDPLRESLETYLEIKTLTGLYSSSAFFLTKDMNKRNLYLDIWDEAFNEMTEKVQELLLFNMKIGIEEQMMYSAMVPQTYEEYRLKMIQYPTLLTIEGYCKNCNLGYPFAISVLDYHEKTTLHPNKEIMVECRQCRKISVYVPTIY